jgi:hypothetical protein
MKPSRAVVSAFVLFAVAAPVAEASNTLAKAQGAAPAAPLVPRNLGPLAQHEHALVQLARGVSPAVTQKLRRAGGLLISRSLGVWRVPSVAARRLAPSLALSGALREIEPDREYTVVGHIDAGDPLLPSEWWLSHVGADRVEPPGPGRAVTIVDSGLDLTHPEFAGRPNTTPANPQSVEGEDEFHGTSVSSVIGAPANGIGLVGVYPQAVLTSWDASQDGLLRGSDVIAGIEAAVGPGVLNLSIGSTFSDPIEDQAVLHAYGRGVVIVAAAGNEGAEGSPRGFPASLPHVFTVGATDQTDQTTFFSSRSPAMDLGAPGDDITAAAPLSTSPSGYVSVSGTSFAAPIVAGAAAWIWTQRPTLDKTQIAELLRRTARDIGRPGRDEDSGFGLLDIPSALAGPAPPRDPLEPNDDVLQVRANGLFAVAKPALTSPVRARATVNARIDAYEDPEDVYRLWVPAGRRLTVTLRSARDIDLQIWNGTTRTVLASGTERRQHLLSESARRGSGNELASFVNRASRGVYVFLDVFMRAGVDFLNADYSAQITNARVQR